MFWCLHCEQMLQEEEQLPCTGQGCQDSSTVHAIHCYCDTFYIYWYCECTYVAHPSHARGMVSNSDKSEWTTPVSLPVQ